MDRIEKVAERAGIDAECLDHYGKYIAKLPLSIVDEAKVKKSRLILVTAITATKAGIGKTTVSVGLALGLNRIGKRVSVALREPSLGPCFGVKGGAARFLFVCPRLAHPYVCLSGWVSTHKKKASRQGGFLVVDKERCYFFMMRVVAMPLAVATRTTYTPGARPSTLACCPTAVATRLPAAL